MGLKPVGKVYLVGAGPGDPGLLTLKGKDCLAKADVVVYDNLANRAFLKFAGPEAELVYVGKQGGDHTLGQEEINALIIQRAQTGCMVVRLKGGDPFIFGRGGEEAQELVKAGISFEVVPGITSAIAVPGYAGIPLTHRDFTSTVAFITGHEDPRKEQSSIAWDKIATGAGTLVFLMGVGNLPRIADRLMRHGRPPETPVAVIRNGTTAEQESIVSDLRHIAQVSRERNLKPPAVILVGEVVGLRKELNWFEERPLFGRRIVVTRAREQASSFLEGLTRLGAEGIEFPTIEIAPPESWQPLDQAIQSIATYDWMLFTSVNGVRHFLARLEKQGKDVRDLKGVKIGAIGPKTAEEWKRMGITPDLVPEEYRAEALADLFTDGAAQGLRILLPRAAAAREVLPEELTRRGARVDVVPAYRTIKPPQKQNQVENLLDEGKIDMITFTSSSTVTYFLEMFHGKDPATLKKWISGTSIACIGPVTADTAREKGLNVNLVPEKYTIEALTGAIVEYFSKGKKNP
jgi:uroporphyrinogen III methyltransferase / synthase